MPTGSGLGDSVLDGDAESAATALPALPLFDDAGAAPDDREKAAVTAIARKRGTAIIPKRLALRRLRREARLGRAETTFGEGRITYIYATGTACG
jgi:hypothetical protein